jgi:uncharacterized protein
MPLGGLFDNPVLWTCLTAWMLAQILKLPIEYLYHRRWNWSLLISTGGMPSSHTALVISNALAVGLFDGFHTSLFALSVVVAMVVIYDATGIRRQAGYHARRINFIFDELFNGQPISDQQLKEVLGHTPREVIGGVVLAVIITLIYRLLWK